jgi:hypothetical protein
MKMRNKLIFSDKKNSPLGIASFAFGIVSLVSFFVIICYSYSVEGNAGPFIGGLGILSFMAAFAGLVLGVESYRLGGEEERFLFSHIGCGLNSLLMIVWIVLFVIGI